MMRILVAGGCGFVGAALCRRLLAVRERLAITVIDSLRRPGSEVNRTSLSALGVSVTHGDVRVRSDVEAATAGERFDWVIDAAAEASVLAASTAGPGVTTGQLVEHNVFGTVHLLEAAARMNAGVMLISTSRVYSVSELMLVPLRAVSTEGGEFFTVDESRPTPPGISARGISEACSTSAPVSLYGATKIAGEVLAAEYAHRFGTPLFVNRCGVMAGAGQFGTAAQGIFSWWIHSWARRRPLSYLGFGGRGLQVRDCLHPDDLADLAAIQMTSGGHTPTVCNVSGGQPSARSLAQLAHWCEARFGAHAIGSDDRRRSYDVPWVVLDHALASSRFAWQPCRDVESILEEIARHAERFPDWLDYCGR